MTETTKIAPIAQQNAQQTLAQHITALKPLVRPTLMFGISLFALTVMLKSVVRDKAKRGAR